MYFILSKHLQNQGIKNVLVGESYTTIISDDDFGKKSLDDDPGSFSVEEPYSDFSYNSSLSILSPKFELKDMPKIINNYEVESSIKKFNN